jgi:hypothetical protein
MTRIMIRNPVAAPRPKNDVAAVNLNKPIKSLRVGLRGDSYWQSWPIVTEEWSKLLRAEGAIPVPLEVREHTGTEGQHTKDIVDAWASSVDCAVVGLAN